MSKWYWSPSWANLLTNILQFFKCSNLACHFHEGVILEVDLVTEVKLTIRIAGMVVGSEHWDSASMPKCRAPFLSGFQLLKVSKYLTLYQIHCLSWWGLSNLG